MSIAKNRAWLFGLIIRNRRRWVWCVKIQDDFTSRERTLFWDLIFTMECHPLVATNSIPPFHHSTIFRSMDYTPFELWGKSDNVVTDRKSWCVCIRSYHISPVVSVLGWTRLDSLAFDQLGALASWLEMGEGKDEEEYDWILYECLPSRKEITVDSKSFSSELLQYPKEWSNQAKRGADECKTVP